LEIIERYFPNLTVTQRSQMSRLHELYKIWNDQINVISRKDIEQLYERHVLHSLAIYKFIPFQPSSNVLDIGTGGGFPGIPLAIMMPDVKFVLVDSIGKKIKVVNEVASALELKNVQAFHIRAENINEKFDFVVSRAVAELPLLLSWCRSKVKKQQINAIPNGLICLKGGNLREELKTVKRSAQVFEVSSFFNEEFFETKKLVYIPV